MDLNIHDYFRRKRRNNKYSNGKDADVLAKFEEKLLLSLPE